MKALIDKDRVLKWFLSLAGQEDASQFINRISTNSNAYRNKHYKDAYYMHAAEIILEASQKLVPVDTGRLKKSGHIEQNSEGTYSIVYDAPYALFVHEIMGNYHKPPTQAKYLEDVAWQFLTMFNYIPFTFNITKYGNGGIALNLDALDFEKFAYDLIKVNRNQLIINSGNIDYMKFLDDDLNYNRGLKNK